MDPPKDTPSEEAEVLVEQAKDPESGKEADGMTKGVDENQYPMRTFKFTIPGLKDPVMFNPAVTFIGLVTLWAFTIYCVVDPDEAQGTLGTWFSSVIDQFTWFYIVANPVLTFFIVWVAYRYGHIKLGKEEDEPEFSNATYFAMIFSAGIGVGLFFYGVSEPLWHSEPDNYYSNAGYRSQDEISQWSLVITLYHWGFAGWSPYLTVAIASALASYKFGLPLTIRSTFYPILGDYCWGWMGDVIDGYSIVMTVAGVCTSLGLGAIQIVAGLQDLQWVDPEREDLVPVFVILIWIITLFATISVVSGLKNGIKILANIGFWLGNFIMFFCFAMEKTGYLLNLFVQTTGTYLQYNIFKLPFWTDAFGELEPGEGRAIDGNASAQWFIGAWTVFYMAWWVAWACFVGMFIARISKNRTIREVVVAVFICPTVYSILWFSFMGGIGLRQARQALELEQIGEQSFGDPAYFLAPGMDFCYDVPQEDVVVNGTTVFTNNLLGITPVCQFDRGNDSQSWFNVMNSFTYPGGEFGGFGRFLSVITIFTLAIYFITSSDSGSLVVDTLASNGESENHHWIQRIFWAVTEGAVACALIVAGGNSALRALQTASIVFGLPFNLFLFVMCLTIKQMCDSIEREQNPEKLDPALMLPKKKESWSMPLFGGVFNIFEYIFSLFCCVHESRKEKGMHLPTSNQTTQFFAALFFPFVSVYVICMSPVIDTKQNKKVFSALITLVYTGLFIAWIVVFGMGTINEGFVALGWTLFFANAIILTGLRRSFRDALGYPGNVAGDMLASSFFYPQCLCQMMLELQSENVMALAAGGHED